MSGWSPDAGIAIDLCKDWAVQVRSEINCDVYLFGSAIYDEGHQFDAHQSDLDLVVLFHEDLDATGRATRLGSLYDLKLQLEVKMIPRLHRTNCTDPGVSILPITTLELEANIHKSRTRRFFNRNIFLNLETDLDSIGLPGASTVSVTEDARQALEYAQGVRNQFLAVSGNGTGGLSEFDEADPLPKALARAAAQLVPDSPAGSWYDTRFGLEHLFEDLSRRKGESNQIEKLYRLVSVRRGGRGKREPLSAFDQLLATEILYDRAAAEPTGLMATWEIRFAGSDISMLDHDRLLAELRRLVPDAEILGTFVGSIIVRVRSAMHSFLTLQRLQELGVLAKFFGAEEVDIHLLRGSDLQGSFTHQGVLDRLADWIAEWRPREDAGARDNEEALTEWLRVWLGNAEEQPYSVIYRDALVGTSMRPLRSDLLVRLPQPIGSKHSIERQEVAIEVVRLRSRRDFFAQIERAQRFALPTILVVIGSNLQLESLKGDIETFTAQNGAFRIVPIPLDQ